MTYDTQERRDHWHRLLAECVSGDKLPKFWRDGWKPPHRQSQEWQEIIRGKQSGLTQILRGPYA